MARSPVAVACRPAVIPQRPPAPKPKKKPQKRLLRNLIRKKAPRRRLFHLRFACLVRNSLLFRLGMKYAVRSHMLRPRKTKIKIKIVEKERIVKVPDLKLRETADAIRKRNVLCIKDNAALKVERVLLLDGLHKSYRTDLDLHELSVNNEALKRAYARLLIQAEANAGDIAQPNLDEFKAFLPDYKCIAKSKATPAPFPLSLPARFPMCAPRMAQSPERKIYRVKEEDEEEAIPFTRTSNRSWTAPRDAATNKRQCKRRTALPGEIERSIASFTRQQQRQTRQEDEEADSADDDAQQTPTHNHDIRSPTAATHSGRAARNTPESAGDDRSFIQPGDLTMSADRTFTRRKEENERNEVPEPKSAPPEILKTPKKKRPFDVLLTSEGIAVGGGGGPGARRSVGVRASPRLQAQTRRSLQASFGTTLNFDLEKEEEDAGTMEEITLEDALGVPSVLEPSWANTLADVTADEEEDFSGVSTPGPSSASKSRCRDDSTISEDEGAVTGARGRPSRAAKTKIQTLKEPSLNTKMRRPAGVEPLTASQDNKYRRLKPRKPLVSSASKRAPVDELVLSD
ncbi:hypothetical protein BV898_05094 [Hypsibius exemplaris]|uniref:Shugoshin C-terminal domain-containing protein n=1 Tax=Hypsibius exemplaris TaxID=2072580 RepID=A0A1W0X0Q6_HYPEX|nr:hypothetical protein BV898_05094 [Hypsibius exemplaris]